jgi:hypothetical protein
VLIGVFAGNIATCVAVYLYVSTRVSQNVSDWRQSMTPVPSKPEPYNGIDRSFLPHMKSP